MLKLGYSIRMTASVGLIGLAVLLGLDALVQESTLEMLAGMLCFGGAGCLATYTEMKRLEGLA